MSGSGTRWTVALLFAAAAAVFAEPAASDQQAGADHFFRGEIAEAIEAWDRHLTAHPADRPGHWQWGLALYYAGRYADGRRQFEEHRAVNPHDVENAAWHFLCVARESGLDAAAKALIPVKGDARVPMAEIHALFAGKGSEADVLRAAEAAGPAASLKGRNARCYAHLYLGLYAEAAGDATSAKRHMLLAAHDFRMDHYMGRTAQLHCTLRKWNRAGG